MSTTALPACHQDSPQHAAYVARVEELEAEGCDTSDAQGIADMEFDGLLTQTKKPIKPTHKMKLTIRHDQSSIDPSATYTDEQFAQVKKSLEREYTKALLAEYPDAEIEFEESTDTKSIVVKTSSLDDPSEIEDNIQRICETVFETGLFWI